MSFIKKIDETNSPQSTKSEETIVVEEPEHVEKPPHNSAESEAVKAMVEEELKNLEESEHVKTTVESADESKSVMLSSEPIESEKETKEDTQIEILQCLHDEIILCECCMHPITPSSTFIHTNKPEIFHLTATDDEMALYEAQKVDDESKKLVEAEKRPDLKQILLRNYDPKFATRIGIKNFVPVEVMSDAVDGTERKLEFIPFETIDQSYPK